jgi:hypothetical protein
MFIRVLKFMKADNHYSIIFDHCYTLIDIYDTLHVNNVEHVKFISHAEFFIKTSPAECMFYVKLDEFVDINIILKSVLDISSMRSFNSAYSCKFIFNFIGHHAVNKFYACALCITCDKFAELKLNRISNTSCEPYFSLFEMKRLFSACYSEQSKLFPCSYSSLKERNHVQTCSIHSSKEFQSTCGTIEYERYISKPLHELSIENYWNIKYASFSSFDIFDFAKINIIK